MSYPETIASSMEVFTVPSKTGSSPVTIQSSDFSRHVAAPMIDLTANDTPPGSRNTIEYVASSPRPASSISSEDLDLVQARAVELQLASEEAELARVALAAKREAAAAQRRFLEAKARSAKSSRASGSARGRGDDFEANPEMNSGGAGPVNNAEANITGRVSLHRQEGTMAAQEPVANPRVTLPERSGIHPAAGVWNFLFPNEEAEGANDRNHDPRHPDHRHSHGDRPRQHDRRRERQDDGRVRAADGPTVWDMFAHREDEGRAENDGRAIHRDLRPPREDLHRHEDELRRGTLPPREHDHHEGSELGVGNQLAMLKKKIAEIEAREKEKKGIDVLGAADPISSRSSGFVTPPQSLDIPLIDLSSPPRAKVNKGMAEVSLIDLPDFPAARSRSASPARRADRRPRDARANNENEINLGVHSSDNRQIVTEQRNFNRMDIHPLMSGGIAGQPGGSGPPDLPPGLGEGPGAGPPPGPRNRVKEADEIKVSQLPEIPQFTAWKQQLRSSVMSASGKGRAAFEWIMAVEDPSASYSELEYAGEYESLDVKLAAGINKVAKGRIGKILTTLIEAAARQGQFVSGRQLLRVIYEQYELDRAKGQVFDLSNLMALSYPGDDKMESFLDTWNDVVQRLTKDPGEDILREILHPLIESSGKLRSALEIYELADEGTPQRSYQFLHRALSIHVEKDRHRRNRSDLVTAMNKFPAFKNKISMPAAESIDEEKPDVTAPAKEKKGSPGPCYAYLRGNCARGSACRYSHAGKQGSLPPMSDKEKTELAEKRALQPCRMFQRGQCKYGDKCQYRHEKGGQLTAAACINSQDFEFSDFENEISVLFDLEVSDDDGGDDCDPDLIHDVICDECTAAICHGGKGIEWVVDTGTENHLVMRSKIDPEDPGIHRADRPLRLATANGTITADQRVIKDVPELGVSVDPLMLDHTVDALSVGRLVLDESYSFHWPSGGPAYFTDKDGKIIECTTRGYVPVISSDFGETSAMPGVGVQADSPDADIPDSETKEQRLKREAQSPEHCLTHLPKNPYCWVCSMTKMTAKQARRLGPNEGDIRTEKFGDHVCADHVTGLDEQKERVDGNQAALFIIDLHSRFPCLAPVKDKSAESAVKAINHFMGNQTLDTFYSDNSRELEVAGRAVAKVHATSTPYRPQSNSIAERGIRTLLEATRAALVQAGMPCRFWPVAGSHASFAIAISEQTNGDPSPFELMS